MNEQCIQQYPTIFNNIQQYLKRPLTRHSPENSEVNPKQLSHSHIFILVGYWNLKYES